MVKHSKIHGVFWISIISIFIIYIIIFLASKGVDVKAVETLNKLSDIDMNVRSYQYSKVDSLHKMPGFVLVSASDANLLNIDISAVFRVGHELMIDAWGGEFIFVLKDNILIGVLSKGRNGYIDFGIGDDIYVKFMDSGPIVICDYDYYNMSKSNNRGNETGSGPVD